MLAAWIPKRLNENAPLAMPGLSGGLIDINSGGRAKVTKEQYAQIKEDQEKMVNFEKEFKARGGAREASASEAKGGAEPTSASGPAPSIVPTSRVAAGHPCLGP